VVLNATDRLRCRPHYSIPSISEFFSELLTLSEGHAPVETGMHVFPRFIQKKSPFFSYFT